MSGTRPGRVLLSGIHKRGDYFSRVCLHRSGWRRKPCRVHGVSRQGHEGPCPVFSRPTGALRTSET
jgi:hypothetical protein